uniref:Uncharacterized protein n=1 Tax=Chrysemys picta bellii TaxID=8478 RepID=A0A8C3F8Y2_CHRPI
APSPEVPPPLSVSEQASEEAHRLQFRSGAARPGEAPREMLARLSQAARLWLRPGERTKEQIVDVVVREQFLGALQADVRAWVTAREPRSSEEAAVLAEACLGQEEPTQPAQVAETTQDGEMLREQNQETAGLLSAPHPSSTSSLPEQGYPQLSRQPSDCHEQEDVCASWGGLEGQEGAQPTSPGGGSVGHKYIQVLLSLQPEQQQQRPCPECGKIFVDHAHLLRHQRLHALEKPFPCPDCWRGFLRRCDLSVHRRSHTGEIPFPCPDCGEGFLRRCDLAAHRKSHMGEWPHQCPKCGRRFRKRSVLVNHQRTHLQDDRYKCPECGQGFKWPGQLEMHRYSHMEEKRHTCFKCGESFSQRSHLLAHQGSHLGDAPYHCADCGKGFAQHPDLILHRRSHTGDRPFHCPQCGIGFGRSSDLRNHQSVHAGQQPYKCPLCGKGFQERAHLAAHQKSHGGEDFYLGLAAVWTG